MEVVVNGRSAFIPEFLAPDKSGAESFYNKVLAGREKEFQDDKFLHGSVEPLPNWRMGYPPQRLEYHGAGFLITSDLLLWTLVNGEFYEVPPTRVSLFSFGRFSHERGQTLVEHFRNHYIKKPDAVIRLDAFYVGGIHFNAVYRGWTLTVYKDTKEG